LDRTLAAYGLKDEQKRHPATAIEAQLVELGGQVCEP
jgi:hypothetical protein